MKHIPVLVEEVLDGLDVQPAGSYWDGTFGNGGHSGEILRRLSADGHLTGSDRDAIAAEMAAEKFGADQRFHFIKGELATVCSQLSGPWDGFLWDLGTSMTQLKDAERGFSFQDDGPLDMRMDRSGPTTAADLVNRLPKDTLADLIYQNGEERLSRRIAAAIVNQREQEKITTTSQLAAICRSAYPRKKHRIHPATRTFQALRIAVNGELDQLRDTLPQALAKLKPGGRAVVISFHSLEDRIVKHCFREHSKDGGFKVLTKRPMIAEETETRQNPAARSAKLRVLERSAVEATS